MNEKELKARLDELTQLAEERNLDWQEAVEKMPDTDVGARVAALANLLDLNIKRVFDSSASIAEIEQAQQQIFKDLEEEEQRLAARYESGR